MFENLFLRFFNLSSLVPEATIFAPSSSNFFTIQLPIPPVAPVIRTFLFLNSFKIFNISYRIN